jgi:hypothetical protein
LIHSGVSQFQLLFRIEERGGAGEKSCARFRVGAGVPDISSAIGVVTYRPTLYCNVTASEGGGGIANYDGNSWTGNITPLPVGLPEC